MNPEYGVGDVAKELGRRWAEADPDMKSKYEAMAEKDKARYDRVSDFGVFLFFHKAFCASLIRGKENPVLKFC